MPPWILRFFNTVLIWAVEVEGWVRVKPSIYEQISRKLRNSRLISSYYLIMLFAEGGLLHVYR